MNRKSIRKGSDREREPAAESTCMGRSGEVRLGAEPVKEVAGSGGTVICDTLAGVDMRRLRLRLFQEAKLFFSDAGRLEDLI